MKHADAQARQTCMTAGIFDLTGSNIDKTHLMLVYADVFIVQMKQSTCVDARNGTSIK